MDDDNALLREMVAIPAETDRPRRGPDSKGQDLDTEEDTFCERLAAYFAAIDR